MFRTCVQLERGFQMLILSLGNLPSSVLSCLCPLWKTGGIWRFPKRYSITVSSVYNKYIFISKPITHAFNVSFKLVILNSCIVVPCIGKRGTENWEYPIYNNWKRQTSMVLLNTYPWIDNTTDEARESRSFSQYLNKCNHCKQSHDVQDYKGYWRIVSSACQYSHLDQSNILTYKSSY